jgi:NHL repeat
MDRQSEGGVGVCTSWGEAGRVSLLRSVGVVGLLTLLLVIGTVLIPAAASAASKRVARTSFGATGSGDGQFELAEHSGLAINDETGDVYVADTGNHRVDQFSSAGTFIRAFGANVGGAGVDVCTVGCVAGTSGSAPGAFEAPVFVAIDNSASASNGDVYVADTSTNLVTKFEADGTLVSSWGVGGQLNGSAAAEGPFTEVAGIAVDSAGNLDVFEVEPHLIFQFDETGAFIGEVGTPRGSARAGLAVDGTGSFFKVNGDLSVEKIEGSGTDLGQVDNLLLATSFATDTSSGELFIDTGGSIANYAFEPSGEVVGTGCTPAEFAGCPPTSTFGSEDLSAGAGVAVDGSSHDVYVADPGAARVVAFELATFPDVTTEAAGPVGATSATLNGSVNPDEVPLTECFFEWGETNTYGNVASCEDPNAAEVGEGNAPVSVHADISAGLKAGTRYHYRLVAANADGSSEGEDEEFQTLGPSITAQSAAEVTATSARINGLINPNGEPGSYFVEYVSDADFLESAYAKATKAPASPASIPANVTGTGDLSGTTGLGELTAGSTVVPFSTLTGVPEVGQLITGSGIPPGTKLITGTVPTHLVLSNAATSSGSGVELKAGRAVISNLTITSSGSSFAIGQILEGPGIPPGTTISAIIGSSLQISNFPTEGKKGAALTASGPQAVSQLLSGLSPGITYHFRLVATNTAATTLGPDKLFTTFALPSVDLPDGRAYEMVSPSQKIGEVFAPEPGHEIDGTCEDCLPGIDAGKLPMQTSPDGESVLYGGQPFAAGLSPRADQYLSRRGPSGWGASLALNSSPRIEFVLEQGFRGFSADLSRSVLYHIAALTPDAPSVGGVGFANLYLRDFDGSLQPLVTQEPPQRVPGSVGLDQDQFQVVYAGANAGTGVSPAFGHTIFAANDALTDEVEEVAPPAPQIEATENNLYEWHDGQLRLVNVLPGNELALADAVFGSGRLLSVTSDLKEGLAVDHAISDDGSHIFWSDGASGQVYVRIAGKETVEVQDHEGKFQTASADGSKVLLSDGCLYDLEEEECEDLSEGQGEKFKGILGAAEDLSRVYYVDTASLTGGEENDNHEQAEGGKYNLYLWQQGTTAFIGVLREDEGVGDNFPISRYGDWRASRQSRSAQVSPDGRYLAFMSIAPLSGYDSSVRGGGKCSFSFFAACREVFEYDAVSRHLTCASCNPSGEQPLGPSNLSLISVGLPTPAPPFRQPGNLTANGGGRLFFESQDTLSQRDTNGHIQDVYEWEPNGVGSCKRTAGCVSLISSGDSSVDSMFMDATPSGNDAFFITRAQLVSQDENDQLDLYDARAPHVPGEQVGFPDDRGVAGCGGESCRGPISTPPTPQGTGSAQFSGPGNPPKQHKKKHKHKKKKHKKHHKRGASK